MGIKKILVVDDEPYLREILIENFELEGFEVKSACNGIEALEIIPNFRPHIVLTDIRMPDCDGIELFKRMIKQISPPIPVIFMSGYAGSNELEKLRTDKSFAGFYDKPLVIDNIIIKIKQLLGD